MVGPKMRQSSASRDEDRGSGGDGDGGSFFAGGDGAVETFAQPVWQHLCN